MYSFACVSYEVFCVLVAPPPTSHSINYQIFSGLVPFDKMHNHAVSLQVIRGRRPSRPPICEPWKIACEDLGLDDETWAIIEDCWNTEPAKRPAAKEVRALLSEKIGHTRSSSLQLSGSQSTVPVRKGVGKPEEDMKKPGVGVRGPEEDVKTPDEEDVRGPEEAQQKEYKDIQQEALDTDTICARLFMRLQAAESFTKLVCLQESEAQEMMDLLQKVRLVFVPHHVHLTCLYYYPRLAVRHALFRS